MTGTTTPAEGTRTTDEPRGILRLGEGDRAVRFERTYPTTAEDLWSALTEPERVARWLAPVEGDLRPGGRYRLDFGDDESRGEVLTCEPPHRLQVSWDFPGEPTSTVTVSVTSTDDGAHLVLEHTRLPRSQAAGYGAGWHAHLTGLRAEAVPSEPTGPGSTPSWDEVFSAVLPAYRNDAGPARAERSAPDQP